MAVSYFLCLIFFISTRRARKEFLISQMQPTTPSLYLHLLACTTCNPAPRDDCGLVASFGAFRRHPAVNGCCHGQYNYNNVTVFHFGKFDAGICEMLTSYVEFWEIYSVVLVVVTQQLAIQGVLIKHQTLTAAHDESTAWTGLGSALLVLWKQTHVAASVVGTISITIYLVGISVLHVSTPSLFSLQIFELPNGTTISTRVRMPSLTDLYNSSSEAASDTTVFWNGIDYALPYLSHADPSNLIGVQNSTLYDILGNNNGTGNVSVSAKAFNVTCGSIPNISVSVSNGSTMANMPQQLLRPGWANPSVINLSK